MRDLRLDNRTHGNRATRHTLLPTVPTGGQHMNTDKQLLVGIVMMSLGGFVALLAFTILREQQKTAKGKAEDESEGEIKKSEDDEKEGSQLEDLKNYKTSRNLPETMQA